MREPDNHTAWIDREGDTWVRVDDLSGYGSAQWWPLLDGPNFGEEREGLGSPRNWDGVLDGGHLPFVEASPERTARAIARVQRRAQS
jgi:hypothetical protein